MPPANAPAELPERPRGATKLVPLATVAEDASGAAVPQKPALRDIAATIKARDFNPNEFLKQPCSASSLLYGILLGAGAGGASFYKSRAVRSAGNWFVFTFAGVSIGSWEYCRFIRRKVQQQQDELSAMENAAAGQTQKQ